MKQDEIIRDIPKGIIGWYDFNGVESALYLGTKDDALYEELSAKVAEVRLYDESDSLADLILCSTAFEKIRDLDSLFSNFAKRLNDHGKLLLAMNNRLGIKYFCGDRDPYTERNFDGIEDYRRAYSNAADAFNGRCYSQNEIKDILREVGFDVAGIKFYSVYPSIDEPTFLYEDGYVPNEDLANRIHPTYNYPKSVFLDEDALYNDLVKNSLFHKMANGYLVEVVKNGVNCKISHVTNSIERGREDALYTLLSEDGVIKRAAYSEGNSRLENLNINTKALASRGANVVSGNLSDNNGLLEFKMPFIDSPTTQKYLRSLVDKGDREGFISVLEAFRDELARLYDSSSQSVFIDMVPLNSFYVDGRFVFFDQEFCLKDIPLEVQIFRMIATLYAGDVKLGRFIPRDELLKHFKVYDNWREWEKYEWDWLGPLWNKDELAEYHRDRQKDYISIGSNRQRMNYSQADYERLFLNVFENLDNRKLILFGSGNYTRHFLMIYSRTYPVYAIIDNNPEKWGTEFEGIKICSPDILKELRPVEYKLIVCIKNYLSVMKQLEEMGVGNYSIYDAGKDYPIPLKAAVVEKDEANGAAKRYHVGYVAGAFDMFHLGHLNLLKRAKEQCDYLIAGVISDDTIEKKKNKRPIISEEDRREIVSSCRYVDQAEILPDRYNNIVEAYRMFKFDVMFSGNDHADDPDWLKDQRILEGLGADIVFFDYTQKVSSTMLRKEINS